MRRKAGILLMLVSCTIGLSSCVCIFIYDSTHLLSIINSLQYMYYGPYTTWNLPISKDVKIIGTVTISSEQLVVPEECTDQWDCRNQVGFEDKYGADGISLTSLSSDGDIYPPCVPYAY